MARIRTIKPEFWQDEKLSALAPLPRLVFLGLISIADDAGRVVDSVKMIDGQLFPSTDDTVRDALAELADLGRIQRYAAGSGQRLLQVVNWQKHQKIDNPSRYNLPGPPEAVATLSRNPSEELARPSRNPSEALAKSSGSDLVPSIYDLGPSTHDQRPLAPTRKNRDSAAKVIPWLAPIAAAFHAEMGVGSFPFGQAARQLAPLTKAGHSPEQIAAHLSTYLALRGDEFGHLKDDPTRIGMTGWVPSLKAFVLTFAKWSPTADGSCWQLQDDRSPHSQGHS